MMAQPVPHLPADKKRVKVYELRNNDWFDRGTGFCTAAYISMNAEVEGDVPREPKVIVESEEEPARILLDTRICKEDGFQKQQDTLIVWTEPSSGIDMALSFQEADGCSMIWKFVHSVQQSFQNPMGPHDDSLSDDLALDLPNPISLPPPELGSLPELETTIRIMTGSATGRDALAKCITTEDYIAKLIPLVEMAEDLESLQDLHRLCNIMKTILLLNDTSIIEHAVSDECVLGVVGALEYDPDFPSHKANHRQWLDNQSRYKEVVRIQDDQVRRKIHQTYRLQYLKDVVLARILDDPTFSVLNSLIFFNQVDIVQHLQSNNSFLSDLFGIFADPNEEQLRKKEAITFIQQCCAIAKNLQPPARQALYNNFLAHGLLLVINFGLRNYDVSVRVGATDILVSMIDHDPQMIRHTIYRQIHESQPPLTDTLIDLLLVEVDLGIRSQISDALKVLCDPEQPGPPPEHIVAAAAAAKGNGAELIHKRLQAVDPQQDNFLAYFYEHSATKLFKPLLDLEGQTDLKFSVMTDGIFSYLNDILCFYVRQHGNRIKIFAMQRNLIQRFLQLVTCRDKHLQIVAIRFFRHLIAQQDEFWIRQVVEKNVFAPILDLLLRTLPRDNLVCSACLDIFDFTVKASKDLVRHLVETHREKIQSLAYMKEPFNVMLEKYEQSQSGYNGTIEPDFPESEDDMAAKRLGNANTRGMIMSVDADEDHYWNSVSDDEEEPNQSAKAPSEQPSSANGGVEAPKPLVDYPSDEEADDNGDTEMATPVTAGPGDDVAGAGTAEKETPRTIPDDEEAIRARSPLPVVSPPERVSEKRRREEDEDDELSKLMQSKRRNSSSASMSPSATGMGSALTKKKSFTGRESPRSANANKKMAISISPGLKVAATATAGGQGSSGSEGDS